MKVYSYTQRGKDGNRYNIRLLATPEELSGWIAARLVPVNVQEVVGWVHAEPELVDAATVVDRIRIEALK